MSNSPRRLRLRVAFFLGPRGGFAPRGAPGSPGRIGKAPGAVHLRGQHEQLRERGCAQILIEPANHLPRRGSLPNHHVSARRVPVASSPPNSRTCRPARPVVIAGRTEA